MKKLYLIENVTYYIFFFLIFTVSKTLNPPIVGKRDLQKIVVKPIFHTFRNILCDDAIYKKVPEAHKFGLEMVYLSL